MIIFEKSIPFEKKNKKDNEKIILIQQYFIHPNKKRHNEIVRCLINNVKNQFIDEIILLNEKIYNDEELGVKSDKIRQVNIGIRMRYRDVFDIIENENLEGYIIFSNSDIYLDDSIEKLRYSKINNEKIFISLLRFDIITNTRYKIFGPRSDSQDTWILHSKFNIDKQIRNTGIFNFQFGKPGCDNKILYLMKILGFKLLNCPLTLKTFHIHNTEIRDYGVKDILNKPYLYLEPYEYECNKYPIIKKYNREVNKNNNKLFNYIKDKINTNKKFIIPRIAGIENNMAFYGLLIKNNRINTNNTEKIFNQFKIMKNNAGIKLETINDLTKYSDLYLDSFNNCEIYSDWEKYGDVYKYISQSHDYIEKQYNKKLNKENLWAFTYDIFHYIHSNPWTLSLANKKILIVSSFIDSIKDKINIRENIYGIDLFPNCEFVFIKPPQTNGTNPSEVFNIELEKFQNKIIKIKDSFDIALVSCGGYGNLICNEIYKMGKSSIYVGGVLQMYFGIYGARWLRERNDIMRLYLNNNWSRPKETENQTIIKI